MSTAAAERLRSLIEEASAEVSHHLASLKLAQEKKNELERQLNALNDPVARLPLEISSEIFMHCAATAQYRSRSSKYFLPSLPSVPHDRLAIDRIPMVLLSICHEWTKIALSTAGLWTNVDIELPRGRGFDKLLELWLSRARHRSLSISLHGSVGVVGGPDVASTFGRWSHKLHNLELYPTRENDLGALFEGAEPFLALKSLTMGFEEDHGRVGLIGAVLKMVRLAPTLEECTLNNVFAVESDHRFRAEPLVLPHLRFLDLASRNCRDDDLVRYLTLPNLETLTVSRINWGTLDNFLERSSPPLRNLSVRHPNSLSAGFNFFNLIHICMIAHLDLQYDTMGKDVLNQLGVQPPEECFPNLHTLRIMNFSPKSFSPNILSAALAARRGHHTPLQALVLRWRTRVHAQVRGDASSIVAALREFSDGMTIYVGTKRINMMTRDGGNLDGSGGRTSTAAA
ncbi:hypothetical protein C8R45DRAFT_1100900 [Mycena sanguinolenta]|nr:hypothetical protein C8R45DRAFT_1100900 [Mycena sanguinolenta]